MSSFKILLLSAGTAFTLVITSAFVYDLPRLKTSRYPIAEMNVASVEDTKKCCEKPPIEPPSCVFKSLMGEESNDSAFIFHTPAAALKSIDQGLGFLAKAQSPDGGWSAQMGEYGVKNYGKSSRVKNDDKTDQSGTGTPSDPASTAMVCMALMRCQNTLEKGQYATQLAKGIEFLLKTTERNRQTEGNNTTISGTQPQRKLGANIDVVLTAQCFSNLLHYLDKTDPMYAKVKNSLNQCVQKIESNQMADGSFKNSGWAGVLQSSFANNALESAREQGVQVNDSVLAKSRDYQNSNVDIGSGRVKTDKGAGIILYSVSSSSRASAQEARKAKEAYEKAQKSGLLKKEDKLDAANLQKAGLKQSDALRYATAYEVNTMAKTTAQRDDIMSGFGNNGGEEFLSYLQTGEGLVIARDTTWKNWYMNISGKMVKIQNNDGSWNGHHCITSPVFCTATCLLVLSVNNDIALLQKQGQ
jgi:hypothetical protein